LRSSFIFAGVKIINVIYIYITVTKLPNKLVYVEDASLDTAGMELTLHYNNGTEETVTTGWIEIYDFSITGTRVVTIKYGEHIDSFFVTVIPKTLTHIHIQPPSKTVYLIGESLNIENMIVTAFYDNGTSESVVGYTVNYDFSQTGTRKVVVKFGEKEASFNVTVTLPNVITSLFEALKLLAA